MNCEELKSTMMSYLDGELPEEERARFERHLSQCETCADEFAGLGKLKEELAMLKFREPSDVELEAYWRGVYNRLERGVGWVFFSAATGTKSYRF